MAEINAAYQALRDGVRPSTAVRGQGGKAADESDAGPASARGRSRPGGPPPPPRTRPVTGRVDTSDTIRPRNTTVGRPARPRGQEPLRPTGRPRAAPPRTTAPSKGSCVVPPPALPSPMPGAPDGVQQFRAPWADRRVQPTTSTGSPDDHPRPRPRRGIVSCRRISTSRRAPPCANSDRRSPMASRPTERPGRAANGAAAVAAERPVAIAPPAARRSFCRLGPGRWPTAMVTRLVTRRDAPGPTVDPARRSLPPS
jgi:hypothetical protein